MGKHSSKFLAEKCFVGAVGGVTVVLVCVGTGVISGGRHGDVGTSEGVGSGGDRAGSFAGTVVARAASPL